MHVHVCALHCIVMGSLLSVILMKFNVMDWYDHKFLLSLLYLSVSYNLLSKIYIN